MKKQFEYPVEVPQEEELSSALDSRFVSYAFMSLEDRALPDARDGLKPSQRRVLVAMNDLHLNAGGSTEKSAKICGDCFIAGTLIATTDGLKSVENINVGDLVYNQETISKVVRTYVKDAKPLLTLTLKDGREITVTPDQKFKVFNENLDFIWKKANDISTNDYIVGKKNTLSLNRSNNHDEEWAYFLGLFLADGWLDRDREVPRICFADEFISHLRKIQKIIYKHFSYKCNINKTKANLFEIRINKINVVQQIFDKIKLDINKYAWNIEIPQWILSANQQVVTNFISGYWDGDGWIRNKSSELGASSISEKFIRQLQILLWSQGIKSSIKAEFVFGNCHINGNKVKTKKMSWTISITGKSAKLLCNCLKIYHPYRKQTKKLVLNRSFFGENHIPYIWDEILKVFREQHLGGGWYNCDGVKKRCGLKYNNGTKIRYSGEINQLKFNFDFAEKTNVISKLEILNNTKSQKLLEVIRYINSNNLSFEKISNITSAQPQKTYDFEVDNHNHELISNGLVTHNCSGNYHPHGETVVYPTMYRMVQQWVLRYPLLLGQGNFGNPDGDPPAAQRYTEAKLSRYGECMLADLSENVVPHQSNYNEKRMEPTILPAVMPNLLVNGCEGIAVGWATKILPHNLKEVVAVVKEYIKNPDVTCEKLIKLMPGPDFPTGGKLLGQSGVLDYYKTGRGSIRLEGSYEIQKDNKGNQNIIVTELPYQTSPDQLCTEIHKLVEGDKDTKTAPKITGISDLKNLSSKKTGIRVVIEIAKNGNAELILNNLLKLTCLRRSFGVNQTVLINGKVVPEANLLQLVKAFADHRQVVLTNKYTAELKVAKDRIHILDGLIGIVDKIDLIIKIIRNSDSPEEAEQTFLTKNLVSSLIQAKAVLAITLRQLTRLEENKLLDERNKLLERIQWLEKVLSSVDEIRNLIIEEQDELVKKYGDNRRTKVANEALDIADEDLIEDSQLMISLTGDGYVKSVPIENYRVQNRGGAGSLAISKSESAENIFEMFEADAKNIVLFFTNKGIVYYRKAYEIPQIAKTSKGLHVRNLLSLAEDEFVTNMITLKSLNQEGNLVIVTKNGLIKKTAISEYETNRRNAGITAINLCLGDSVAFACITNGRKDVFIVTEKGQCVRYSEKIVPEQARATKGSRALKLDMGDKVAQVFMLDAKEVPDILVVTTGGIGKKTSSVEYKALGNRQVKGYSVVKKQTLLKNGFIVGACSIEKTDSVLVMTSSGKSIRLSSQEIKETGRTTAGVRIVKLDHGETVVKIAKVSFKEE